MHGELIKIGLESDGSGSAKVKGFGARFIRKLAEIRLRSVDDEESAPSVPCIWSVDCPNVDILLLRPTDRGVEIWAPKVKTSAKVINSGREQEDGAPVRGRRPALHQVQKCEIRARERAPATERDAQRFGSKFMVVGKILGEHSGTVARVGYRNVGGIRLGIEKRLQIAPLIGDTPVQRIVNQNGEV